MTTDTKSPISNRQEILFIYEAKDCNPNGDPLDENKPRTDPETGVATVTDVRIKRTVRDYLLTEKKLEILVRDTFNEKGFLNDGKARFDTFLKESQANANDSIQDIVSKVGAKILEKCIDTRLFGCTLPVEVGKKSSSLRLTGPVQFSGFNRSFHRVSPMLVQGTAGFASKKETTQKSFREDHILPYACIGVYGVINEVAARSTTLSDQDVTLLLEGLWKGTLSLITRSKVGHQPLILMRIKYNDGFRIGDLAGRLTIKTQVDHEAIRNSSQFSLEASGLVNALKTAKEKIESVEILEEGNLKFEIEKTSGKLKELLVQENTGLKSKVSDLTFS